MVYASTFLTYGSGVAIVVATGMRTEAGKIASFSKLIQEHPSPFQREVQRMARQMTWLVAGLVLFIVPFLLFMLHDPWVDVALNTLSLAVATVPESLPIVLTFALSLQLARWPGERQSCASYLWWNPWGRWASSARLKQAP
ncbi:MAG: hypothetical protein WCP58_05665 [bacterium]